MYFEDVITAQEAQSETLTEGMRSLALDGDGPIREHELQEEN